jgi:hypothetical protein
MSEVKETPIPKKEDDLVLGGEEPTGEEEIFEEEIDLHAEIASATNALCAIDGIDEQLLSKDKSRMIRTIRRKALEIIHQNIIDIHSNVFGREAEEGEED